jgi:hypothetical protein
MKGQIHRLLLLALATGAIISCDTRLPTASRRVASPGTPPTVVIDSPIVNTQVNLGDSIFLLVKVTGGNSLKNLTLQADKLTGVKDLGTFAETPRFAALSVDFLPGTTDTTIRRYLQVIDPADLTLDSLLILAIVTDSTGLVDTNTVRAAIVSGPHVVIESPAANDSIPPGVGVSISAHATDAQGIGKISIHVTGDPSWLTPLDTTISAVYDASSRDVTFTGIVLIPLNATPRSRVVVNSNSLDGARQPGSAAPIGLFIRSAASIAAPRVTQVVPTASERSDTVVITASGAGIVSIGLIVRDSAGNLVTNDTTVLPPPITSNVHLGVPLRLSLAQQGRHLAITAFAVDQSGRIGYAVGATTAGSESVLQNALVDSTQIVYGQTYTMPLASTVGDVVADVVHGNVFMSNTSHNRLEVFQNASRTFDPNGIAVGSQPWGMTMSAFSTDTLLVANSGGTNFSRVCIGNCVPMREDLANRVKTRGLYVFTVTEAKDVNTGKITLSVTPVVQFSDRPQYIAQAATGRVYFSTVPTPTASNGTIRWFDPSPQYPAPDPRLINSYATIDEGTAFTYVIFNVDSIAVNAAPVGSLLSDGLYIWDHPYGQLSGIICVNAPGCPQATTGGVPDASVRAALATLAAQNTCSFGPCPSPFFPSDVDAVLRLNIASLGLTDTTFVASSVDRNWLAFGEGHTGGVGRVMLTNDPLIGGVIPPFPLFFSPQVTVKDLTDNASESVLGLALDKTGKTVASHGLQSYFSEVEAPFHLRLQGKYDSFTDGAGIALHPDADGSNTPAAQRLAFVGSSTGKIEIVDIAYFINRGTLFLKYPIYGPLRVSQPMPGDNTGKACPGDPTCVILKLFAITARGLIVVDLTAADIKAGPP